MEGSDDGSTILRKWSPVGLLPLPQIRVARPSNAVRRANSDSYVIDAFDVEQPHVPCEAKFCQQSASERSYPSSPPRSSWWQERRDRRVRSLQQEALAQTWRTLFSPGLARVPSRSDVPTTVCRICLSNVPVTHSMVLMQCGRTHHGSCRDCMAAYLKLRIEEGRVSDLWCPCRGCDDCDAVVTDEELGAWLDGATMAKYRRFTKMAANPQLRSCPGCKSLCAPTTREGGKIESQMTCPDCNAAFCYFHSNAHEPGEQACAAYERAIVKEAMINGAMADTKPCPACGFPTEKVAGCNHMTCKCKVEWCWICEKEITSSVGWHYNPMNPTGCMQFQDSVDQRNCIMLTCKVLALPAYLISLVFLFTHMLLLIVFCWIPACFCCKEIGMNVWLGFTCLLMAIPFGAWILSWGLVSIVLFLLLLPCGARMIHMEYLATVPMTTMSSFMELLTRDSDLGSAEARPEKTHNSSEEPSTAGATVPIEADLELGSPSQSHSHSQSLSQSQSQSPSGSGRLRGEAIGLGAVGAVDDSGVNDEVRGGGEDEDEGNETGSNVSRSRRREAGDAAFDPIARGGVKAEDSEGRHNLPKESAILGGAGPFSPLGEVAPPTIQSCLNWALPTSAGAGAGAGAGAAAGVATCRVEVAAAEGVRDLEPGHALDLVEVSERCN